jgi:hypothetical protein
MNDQSTRIFVAAAQDAADDLAHRHYSVLFDELHGLDVSWGPDVDKAHLAVCQSRERLAQDIRDLLAQDRRATRRNLISRIRAKLRG